MKWQLRQQCHSTCGTGCYSLGILTSLKKLLPFESLLSPNHLVTFPKMKQQNMFLKYFQDIGITLYGAPQKHTGKAL